MLYLYYIAEMIREWEIITNMVIECYTHIICYILLYRNNMIVIYLCLLGFPLDV